MVDFNRIFRKESGIISKKTSVERIIRSLRQAEVLQSQGRTVAQSCKEIGDSEQSFYRWRQKYGSLSVGHAAFCDTSAKRR